MIAADRDSIGAAGIIYFALPAGSQGSSWCWRCSSRRSRRPRRLAPRWPRRVRDGVFIRDHTGARQEEPRCWPPCSIFGSSAPAHSMAIALVVVLLFERRRLVRNVPGRNRRDPTDDTRLKREKADGDRRLSERKPGTDSGAVLLDARRCAGQQGRAGRSTSTARKRRPSAYSG